MSGNWVYILASQRRGTLYVGMTNDLARRTHEHKEDVVDSFTKKYGVHRLVYAERYDSIADAEAPRASPKTRARPSS